MVRRFSLRTRHAGALKKMRVARFAAGATLAMLCACAAPVTDPPTTNAPHAAFKSGDLLYVVNAGDGTVDVYGYPDGGPVATLTGFSHPEGACADAAGNIFIANTRAHDIVEYAHGQTRPKRTLDDGEYLPVDCSIDPVSGNLAVANHVAATHGAGSVAIYRDGRGSPRYFTGLHSYVSCTYDDRGDLFVNGENDSNFYLEELAKSASTFTTIRFKNFEVIRHIGWDGSFVTDEVPQSDWSAIYRFRVSGGQAHFEGATTVAVRGQAFIARPRVIVSGKREVAFFGYPTGRGPQRTIIDDASPVATVVSSSSK